MSDNSKSAAFQFTKVLRTLTDPRGRTYEVRACCFCRSEFSFRGGTTSAALRHLKRSHPEKLGGSIIRPVAIRPAPIQPAKPVPIEPPKPFSTEPLKSAAPAKAKVPAPKRILPKPVFVPFTLAADVTPTGTVQPQHAVPSPSPVVGTPSPRTTVGTPSPDVGVPPAPPVHARSTGAGPADGPQATVDTPIPPAPTARPEPPLERVSSSSQQSSGTNGNAGAARESVSTEESSEATGAAGPRAPSVRQADEPASGARLPMRTDRKRQRVDSGAVVSNSLNGDENEVETVASPSPTSFLDVSASDDAPAGRLRHHSSAPPLTASQRAITHFLQHYKALLSVRNRLRFVKHLTHEPREAEMYNVLDVVTQIEFVKEFAADDTRGT